MFNIIHILTTVNLHPSHRCSQESKVFFTNIAEAEAKRLHSSWGYAMTDAGLDLIHMFFFMMLCFPSSIEISKQNKTKKINHYITMFKPMLHRLLWNNTITWISLTCLGKHPILCQEKACYFTVISSTLNSSYSMKENAWIWFTRVASNQFPLSPLHLQLHKDTGETGLIWRGNIFYMTS